MKKLLLISLSALLLSACADKEQYEGAVLAEMQNEQDIKDYNIDPELITECVVGLSATEMPGLFALDPERLMAYRNYATMLTFTSSENPKEAFVQLKKDFGSPKALVEAKVNYAESVAKCITMMIETSEQGVEE